MKVLKVPLIFFVISSLISCASGGREVRKTPPPEIDRAFARYPAYRIDGKIQRICIIGNGDGKTEIASHLTTFFMDRTVVKVVEPGNLQAILGGKLIEYGTGLTHSESQALSQMLQIDTILLFEEKISPYRDYQYGGRASVTINLKLVNTLNGEVLYQTNSTMGALFQDPRRYGYSSMNELPTNAFDALRRGSLWGLTMELSYAMGWASIGYLLKSEFETIVSNVAIDSVADRMGIKTGDKILEVNGIKIYRAADIVAMAKQLTQGDEITIRYEREGKNFEAKSKVPVIPFKTEEKKKDKPTGKENVI
jgi:hypothetical protein